MTINMGGVTTEAVVAFVQAMLDDRQNTPYPLDPPTETSQPLEARIRIAYPLTPG